MAGLMSIGGGAYAQSFNRSGDPCASSPSYGGNALVNLIGQFQQQQRTQTCLSTRRAQWAEYNARQKAVQDKAAADASQQKEQAQAQANAAKAQAEAALAQAQHSASLAEARAQRRHDRVRVASRREHEDADARRHDLFLQQVRDEAAPDNVCHDAKYAKQVLVGWNALDTVKDAGVRVIDIEHMTTAYYHPSEASVSCHGVFVTNKGWRVVGTATMRRNIAGDPIFVWERDGNQDVSRYAIPAGLDMKVGEPPAVVTKVMAISPAGTPPI